MTSNGSSVLSSMVAGVMQQKASGGAKPATLTPTVLESSAKVAPLGGKHAATFPFDDPQTAIQAVLDGMKEVEMLRQHLDHIHSGLVALGTLYGAPVEGDAALTAAVLAEKKRKDEEAAADARAKAPEPKAPETPEEFKEDFARKQAEAQAAVFGNPVRRDNLDGTTKVTVTDDDEDDDEEETPEPEGWVCPTHRKAIVKRSARRQVDYHACPECDQFEKV